jgi:RNA polymerase sigma factor (sigma-70 family)
MPLALSVTHSAPSCSEHELVTAVRRGDDRAFEILYSRYQRRISSYVYGMVGDHGQAEDVTQEVFISALRRLRNTDQPILFKPWLYEVAKNACIDEFRRSRRGQEVPLERDDDIVGANPRLMALAPTPETAIESKQNLADLRGAFRGLSESHHKVIVLRELEGLSYAQIGEQLGMSQTVVESTLFRARRRLGEEYEDLISGRRCQRVRTVIDEGDTRTATSLGIKERRLIARHLAHCQACRRHAKLVGVDDSLLEQPTLVGKIAALLPIPIWLRSRLGGGGSSSHSAGLVQSAQVAAASPATFDGFARAAAAAVTLVIAGAGTGIVTLGSNSAHHAVARQVPAHAAPVVGGTARRMTPAAASAARARTRTTTTARARTSSTRATTVPGKQTVSSVGKELVGKSGVSTGAGNASVQHGGVSGSPAGATLGGGSSGGVGRVGTGAALQGAANLGLSNTDGLPKLPAAPLSAVTNAAVAGAENLVSGATRSVLSAGSGHAATSLESGH